MCDKRISRSGSLSRKLTACSFEMTRYSVAQIYIDVVTSNTSSLCMRQVKAALLKLGRILESVFINLIWFVCSSCQKG